MDKNRRKGEMKMKVLKRALGVLLITVLASSLSVLTTGIVVNAYIQSVLRSFDIKLDNPVSGISEMVKSLAGMNNNSNETENTEGNQAGSGSTPTDTSDPKDGSVSKTAEDDIPTPEDALPVMGQVQQDSETSGSESEDALDQQLVMTPEAMNDLKNNLPSGEKVNIFNILMTKVPQEEMQKISTAMENGLTEDEVTEIQEVISKYVDKEEYEDLMKMLTPTPSTNP
ncbi:hypothetical protein J2T20_002025 [Paenibacillus wynnii]|nr:hypothetical protein [Paenibacillus wynnii]